MKTVAFVATAVLFASMMAASVTAWQRDTHWERVGYAPDNSVMRLTVALKNQNMDKLTAAAKAISNPQSESYGVFMTHDDITALVAPRTEDIEAVTAFWHNAGAAAVEITASRDFLTVDIPVGAVEVAFGTDVHAYRHRASGRLLHRTDKRVSLPSEIAERVDIVTGLSDFADYPHERKGMKKLHAAKARTASACASSAPDFEGRILGGAGDIGVQVTVYCQNGQPSGNVGAPCADFPPAVSSLSLTVVPQGNHAAINVTANIGDMQCTLRNAMVFCTFPTQYVPKYVRLAISAQTNYDDGTASDVGTYPTLFSTSSYSTPQAIWERYGVPEGPRSTNPKNRQAVTAFEEQYISIDGDLMSFYDAVGLPRQQPIVYGQNNQSLPGGESTLDIQYISGVAPGVPSIFWSVTGPGPAVPPGQGAYILEWMEQVANTSDADIPLVTSISYGDTESGYFWKFGDYSYIFRCEAELTKMAARGMTVVAGSGDAGCSNVGEAGNDISPTDPTCTPFRAFYPSNSYWVTSASSTFATTNALPACMSGTLENVGENIVCERVGEVAVGVAQGLFWTTGGGFSNLTTNPTADYQADAVQAYLETMGAQNKLPPSAYWNVGGRAYPDIAVLGHNELCVFGGALTPVDGTSASGPVFAGLLSLINEERLNADMPPLGHVNPFLYQSWAKHRNAFHDVVVGNNNDGDIQGRCSAFPTSCEFGFDTAPGWDAVTGLGSPSMPILTQLALEAGAKAKQNVLVAAAIANMKKH